MFDLIQYIENQKAFSKVTYGPKPRLQGITNHIREEADEIDLDPTDLEEWIDIIQLGLDGAWRSGHTPQEIVDMLHYKLEKNKRRDWPDWRTSDPDKPIGHI